MDCGHDPILVDGVYVCRTCGLVLGESFVQHPPRKSEPHFALVNMRHERAANYKAKFAGLIRRIGNDSCWDVAAVQATDDEDFLNRLAECYREKMYKYISATFHIPINMTRQLKYGQLVRLVLEKSKELGVYNVTNLKRELSKIYRDYLHKRRVINKYKRYLRSNNIFVKRAIDTSTNDNIVILKKLDKAKFMSNEAT